MATPIPENSVRFTLSELAAIVGGELRGGAAEAGLCGVVTDSRRVAPGNLYVALRGAHHDGHRFAAQALQAGAAAVLIDEPASRPAHGAAVVVADTLKALGALAAEHRRRWGGRVVAITGSAGKTTTKEMTFAALSALGLRVARTEGNLNNRIGVPMSLLAIDEGVELAVLELGTSAAGEIATLASICAPQVAAVTCAAVAHTEGLGTLEDVAREKMSLLASLPAGGVALYNADDAALGAELGAVTAKLRSFGRGEAADVRIASETLTPQPSSRAELRIAGRAQPLVLELSLFGPGPVLDAAAAMAIVEALVGDAQLERAAAALAALPPVPGRLCPQELPGGALLLDDSYNANPASVAASMQTTSQLAHARGGRALAALGDMGELGAESGVEHRRVGRRAAQLGFAALYCYGPEMAQAVEAAQAAAGCASELRARHFDHKDALVSALGPQLRAGDVVLIKGSRSLAMETVVEALSGGGS
ncbi:MAG: UDP-N-acetylmuramoyl-tripeptide--D-alanyl-D-alanine ligase [Myxococcales bacterium]|nr:UDP-N-acetylmuramoyl-tripeptide--D-alanyl-D-alanine ligase [Myxococcales bacterium]